MQGTLTIADPRAAAVFSAPRQRTILLSLVEEERSLSQLAHLTGTSLNLLHHHLGTLLRLRLVMISRLQTRAGAPIKFYRAAARAFFVPAELMGTQPHAALDSRLRELLALNLARTLRGVTYTHEDGGPRMRLERSGAARRPASELWLEVSLSDADAEELAAELRGLLQRFKDRSNKTRRRYLVHAALAPL